MSAFTSFSTVQNVIDAVSQDLRLQLASTVNTAGQPILIDYSNRINKEILRFSRWPFIKSELQYFLTVEGQTDYWIGPKGAGPAGMVDTGLNLIDVDIIQKNSVRDISNQRTLFGVEMNPIGNQFNYKDGQPRQGRPSNFWQDQNDPNIFHLYPGPDNTSTFQPVPTSPILTTVPGGSLLQRSYFVRTTFVDSLGLESTGSLTRSVVNIPAGQLLQVATPILPINQTSSGAIYSSYNVYIGLNEGSETLQPSGPIQLGTNFIEPLTGAVFTGVQVPQANKITTLGAYVIQFRYFKARLNLNDVNQEIQIPDDYFDIFVNGVSALGWKLLSRQDDAQACMSLFKSGLTQMVWDKNLFPSTDFIRPDPATYVNQQNFGILPSTNN